MPRSSKPLAVASSEARLAQFCEDPIEVGYRRKINRHRAFRLGQVNRYPRIEAVSHTLGNLREMLTTTASTHLVLSGRSFHYPGGFLCLADREGLIDRYG